jgi:HEAT repeat protein
VVIPQAIVATPNPDETEFHTVRPIDTEIMECDQQNRALDMGSNGQGEPHWRVGYAFHGRAPDDGCECCSSRSSEAALNMSRTRTPSPYPAVEAAHRAGDVDGLISLLNQAEQRGRIAAAQSLGKMGAQAAVPSLIRALRSSDWVLRGSALNALAAIGDRIATEAIVAVARDDSSMIIRGLAVIALREWDDPHVNELLMDIAVSEGAGDKRARDWAFEQLIKRRATEALPLLQAERRRRSGLARWRLGRALRVFEVD